MFLNKKSLQATAAKYDIDIEGLTFPKAQGVVTKYLAEHDLEPVLLMKDSEKTPEVSSFMDLGRYEPVPSSPVLVRGRAKRIQLPAEKYEPTIEDLGLKSKIILFSPELSPSTARLVRWKEDLGEDVEVEELWYNGETLDQRNIQGTNGTSNGISGTYKVVTIPGSKVEAISALPKENTAIWWEIDKAPFPYVQFQGRRGYLYSHATIPNVLSVLKESGYYEEFKNQLQDEPNIFYLCGIRGIDIGFTHYLMGEIERMEAVRRGGRIG